MALSRGGKNGFLKLTDFSAVELEAILQKAADLKAKQRQGLEHLPLRGKALGLLFEHSSTRTRVAFEVGMAQLGGHAIFLSSKDTQMGRGEPMADTARVMSRYVNAIAARLDSQADLEELARYASIPVINALTKERHPSQILADLLTIREHFGRFNDKRICYIGDSNNVSNSWIEAASILGFTLTLCCPEGYHPDFSVILGSKPVPKNIRWVKDPQEGVSGVDVVCTDVWISMGTADNDGKRRTLAPFQINTALLKHARPTAIVLHCLPAHRGEEITGDVIDGPQSQIFNQAENKLHIQKAVLEMCMT